MAPRAGYDPAFSRLTDGDVYHYTNAALASRGGLAPPTCAFGGRCSRYLSYLDMATTVGIAPTASGFADRRALC